MTVAAPEVDNRSVTVLGDLLGLRPAASGDAVTHWALPNAATPKFYVPTGRSAAAASCLAYNSLRPPPIARRRTAVGWGLRSGLLQRLQGTPMTSGAPTGQFAPSGNDAWKSLVDDLALRLGRREVYFATSPRSLDPFWTPTLQLFDAAGSPVAYAKVGWTELTRAQVTTEADVLARLTKRPGGGFVSPALVDVFTWGGTVVSVTEPMASDVARVSDSDGPFPRALLAVAGMDGPPRLGDFASSGGALWADRLVADGPAAMPEGPWRRFAATWGSLRPKLGGTRVVLGRWHGDWVPWNVARSGSELWVWDWEYSGADRPVGLDAYHWYYQQSRIVDGVDVATALAISRQRVAQHLDSMGVAADTEHVLACAHVLELAARPLNAARLRAPGWERAVSDLPVLCDALVARSEHRNGRSGGLR